MPAVNRPNSLMELIHWGWKRRISKSEHTKRWSRRHKRVHNFALGTGERRPGRNTGTGIWPRCGGEEKNPPRHRAPGKVLSLAPKQRASAQVTRSPPLRPPTAMKRPLDPACTCHQGADCQRRLSRLPRPSHIPWPAPVALVSASDLWVINSLGGCSHREMVLAVPLATPPQKPLTKKALGAVCSPAVPGGAAAGSTEVLSSGDSACLSHSP